MNIIPDRIMHIITSLSKEMEATVQWANDTIVMMMIIMYKHLFKQASRHDKVFMSMSNEYHNSRQCTIHNRIGLDWNGCRYTRYTWYDKINAAFFESIHYYNI